MTPRAAATTAGLCSLIVGLAGGAWLGDAAAQPDPQLFCLILTEQAARSRGLDVGVIFDAGESGCAPDERKVCASVDGKLIRLDDC